MTTLPLGEARRTALILAASQAIIGSAAPIAISLGGLVGYALLGSDKSLATAPVTGFNVGVALGALPAAWLLRGLGRRKGFMSGTLVTAAGGLVAAIALQQGAFWLFCLGLLLMGSGSAFVQQYRFAAADYAPAAFKARAISWVLAGGVFAAVIGPQTVILTKDLLHPHTFAGPFLAILVLAGLGAAILSRLRLPNRDAAEAREQEGQPARPIGDIIGQPQLLVAMICGVGAFALMSFVMTGAPLAMVGCGFTTDEATLGISWHVMAMFAPSFVTGRLISRFGAEAIIALGLLLLIGCAVTALSGIALWQFWSALVLLGVGWNFAFIGATTMVAQTYRSSERSKVQGLHDFVLFSTVAFSSLMSGRVYTSFGWEMLNWIVFPVVAACLCALAYIVMTRRRPAPAAGADM